MGFDFLNFGTVNVFISFGRLDYRIQIQLTLLCTAYLNFRSFIHITIFSSYL